MKGKRIAFELLLATVGLLTLVGAAAAAGKASPQPQSQTAPAEQQAAAKGWLGVEVSNVTAAIKKHFSLSVDSGAVVTKVAPKGPAETAGVKAGDVIQAVNGTAISDTKALISTIQGAASGTVVSLKIARGTDTLTLTATLKALPEPPSPQPKGPFQSPQPKPGNPLPGYIGDLANQILSGNVLRGEFQVLGKDGKVSTIAFTNGKVTVVTGTTLTIERKDKSVATFTTAASDTQVIVGGRRINLSGLRTDSPVVVVEKDGVVTYVLGWPADILGKGSGLPPMKNTGPKDMPEGFQNAMPFMLAQPGPQGRNPDAQQAPAMPALPNGMDMKTLQEQLRQMLQQNGQGPQMDQHMRDIQRQLEQQLQLRANQAQKTQQQG